MEATFIRKVEIETWQVYAVLKVDQERADIKEFLSAIQSDKPQEDPTTKSILKYLEKHGLLTALNELTEKGQEVIETGIFPIEECGTYQWWVVVEDALIKSYLLAFKREYPKSNPNNIIAINSEKLLHNDFVSYLIEKEKDKSYSTQEQQIKIVQIAAEQDPHKGFITRIAHQPFTLTWKWQGLEDSEYKIEGKIKDKDQTIITTLNIQNNLSLDLQTIFINLVKKIDYQFDKDLKYLKIPFLNENMDDFFREAYLSFKFSKISFPTDDFEYGEFEHCEFYNVDITPINKNHAIQWRNWLIEQDLIKKYIHKNKYNTIVKNYNQCPNLKTYQLDNIEIDDFLHDLKERQASKIAFWHLAAPWDLNPLGDLKLLDLHPIHYTTEDTLEFNALVEKLKPQSVKTIIYMDRYVASKSQQDIFELFINALKDDLTQNIILLTEKTTQFKNKAIQIQDLGSFGVTKTQTHDRLLILIHKDNSKTIWKMTASWPAKYQHPIMPNHPLHHHITFVPLFEENLERFLQEFINAYYR